MFGSFALKIFESLEMKNPRFQRYQSNRWKYFQPKCGGIVVIFSNAFPFRSFCTRFEPKEKRTHFFFVLPHCYLDKSRKNPSHNHSHLHPLRQPVSHCSVTSRQSPPSPFKAPSPPRHFPSPTPNKLPLLPYTVLSSFWPCAVLLSSLPFAAIAAASVAALPSPPLSLISSECFFFFPALDLVTWNFAVKWFFFWLDLVKTQNNVSCMYFLSELHVSSFAFNLQSLKLSLWDYLWTFISWLFLHLILDFVIFKKKFWFCDNFVLWWWLGFRDNNFRKSGKALTKHSANWSSSLCGFCCVCMNCLREISGNCRNWCYLRHESSFATKGKEFEILYHSWTFDLRFCSFQVVIYPNLMLLCCTLRKESQGTLIAWARDEGEEESRTWTLAWWALWRTFCCKRYFLLQVSMLHVGAYFWILVPLYLNA